MEGCGQSRELQTWCSLAPSGGFKEGRLWSPRAKLSQVLTGALWWLQGEQTVGCGELVPDVLMVEPTGFSGGQSKG